MAKYAWRMLMTGLVFGALAFTTAGDVDAQDDTPAADIQHENDYFESIGLAGLLGLFGLMRRGRRDHDRNRISATGRTT